MKHLLSLLLILVSVSIFAGNFPLVKGGKAVSCIVVDGYSHNEADSYAAMELADYLEKITGARLEIRQKAPEGVYPIYIGKKFRSKMPAAIFRHTGKVKEDGFLLGASSKGVFIYSTTPAGVIYGAYELLKRYGSVRWFFPGEDGEYIEKKKDFSVPETVFTDNPAMELRTFNHVCANIHTDEIARKWLLRNKMTLKHQFGGPQHGGGHVFSSLMPDIYFREKPELYCLVDGKRVPQCGNEKLIFRNGGRGGQKNQPCTSNPETLQIMKENLIKMIGERRLNSFNIMNNDSTVWCQCDNCRKLDPETERREGIVSTRFWLLANMLIEEGKKVYPYVKFDCSAYQNYQMPPAKVKPDKRASITYCVHHRCYTHSVGDLSCKINERTRKILNAWKNAGLRVSTYEYTNMLPSFDIHYLPLEKVVTEDIKYYASLNGYGYCDEVPPKDAYYGPRYNSRKIREQWRGNFLTYYMQAYFMWNPKGDFEKVLEDIGSKFYGKAWKEMKEYRKILRNAYSSIPAHFMYGTSNVALGMVLQEKDLETKLLSLLSEAEKKAGKDSVLLERIRFEKEYFLLSFVKSARLYAKQQSTPAVAQKISSRIKIDGILDEKEWKNAKEVGNFRLFNGAGKKAVNRSRVRVLWDEKYLYLALEAMDTHADKLLAKGEKHDDDVWMGNNFELFFAPPSFGCAYIHWVINHRGVVYDTKSYGPTDRKLAYNMKVTKNVKVLKDRWIVEMKIPFTELGGTPRKGERWAINIARGRATTDPEEEKELSSWSYEGRFHGPEGFRKILFQ